MLDADSHFLPIEYDSEHELESRPVKVQKCPKLIYCSRTHSQLTQVANEFKKLGKYNIGITAGVETTLAPKDFIDGCNRMDLVLVPSNFTKEVLQKTSFFLYVSILFFFTLLKGVIVLDTDYGFYIGVAFGLLLVIFKSQR